jgi:hypothetical protein
VAVALSRLGYATSTLSRVGDDWMKDLLLNDLVAEGVDISMIQVGKGERTGMSVVLVAPDGGRSIITYRGASKGISSDQVMWSKFQRQIGSRWRKHGRCADMPRKRRSGLVGIWQGRVGNEREATKTCKVDLLILNKMGIDLLNQP